MFFNKKKKEEQAQSASQGGTLFGSKLPAASIDFGLSGPPPQEDFYPQAPMAMPEPPANSVTGPLPVEEAWPQELPQVAAYSQAEGAYEELAAPGFDEPAEQGFDALQNVPQSDDFAFDPLEQPQPAYPEPAYPQAAYPEAESVTPPQAVAFDLDDFATPATYEQASLPMAAVPTPEEQDDFFMAAEPPQPPSTGQADPGAPSHYRNPDEYLHASEETAQEDWDFTMAAPGFEEEWAAPAPQTPQPVGQQQPAAPMEPAVQSGFDDSFNWDLPQLPAEQEAYPQSASTNEDFDATLAESWEDLAPMPAGERPLQEEAFTYEPESSDTNFSASAYQQPAAVYEQNVLTTTDSWQHPVSPSGMADDDFGDFADLSAPSFEGMPATLEDSSVVSGGYETYSGNPGGAIDADQVQEALASSWETLHEAERIEPGLDLGEEDVNTAYAFTTSQEAASASTDNLTHDAFWGSPEVEVAAEETLWNEPVAEAPASVASQSVGQQPAPAPQPQPTPAQAPTLSFVDLPETPLFGGASPAAIQAEEDFEDLMAPSFEQEEGTFYAESEAPGFDEDALPLPQTSPSVQQPAGAAMPASSTADFADYEDDQPLQPLSQETRQQLAATPQQEFSSWYGEADADLFEASYNEADEALFSETWTGADNTTAGEAKQATISQEEAWGWPVSEAPQEEDDTFGSETDAFAEDFDQWTATPPSQQPETPPGARPAMQPGVAEALLEQNLLPELSSPELNWSAAASAAASAGTAGVYTKLRSATFPLPTQLEGHEQPVSPRVAPQNTVKTAPAFTRQDAFLEESAPAFDEDTGIWSQAEAYNEPAQPLREPQDQQQRLNAITLDQFTLSELEVLAQQALGPRQALYYVNARGNHVLLGQTAGRFEILHWYDKPAFEPGQAFAVTHEARAQHRVVYRVNAGEQEPLYVALADNRIELVLPQAV